ncbi:hypothetical protein [Akkermansia sp.]|uniref:hypothetical protein n=1 Tax=Akkermansia sp. TaxID=1872421 RepID=UPI0025C5CE56|nr:hypothetical protein [Akkermansia sp.]
MQFSGNKTEKEGSGQSADKSEDEAEIVIHTRVSGLGMFFDRQVIPTLPRLISSHKNALRRTGMQSHFFKTSDPAPGKRGFSGFYHIFIIIKNTVFILLSTVSD